LASHEDGDVDDVLALRHAPGDRSGLVFERVRNAAQIDNAMVRPPKTTAKDSRDSPTGNAARSTAVHVVIARLRPTVASSRSTGDWCWGRAAHASAYPGRTNTINNPSMIRTTSGSPVVAVATVPAATTHVPTSEGAKFRLIPDPPCCEAVAECRIPLRFGIRQRSGSPQSDTPFECKGPRKTSVGTRLGTHACTVRHQVRWR
jgi:hypothetical protein